MKAIQNVNEDLFISLNKGFNLFHNELYRGRWRIGCRYISSLSIGMGDVEWTIKLVGIKKEPWDVAGSMMKYLGSFGLGNARMHFDVKGNDVLMKVLITGEDLVSLMGSRELKGEFLELSEIKEVLEGDEDLVGVVGWEWGDVGEDGPIIEWKG